MTGRSLSPLGAGRRAPRDVTRGAARGGVLLSSPPNPPRPPWRRARALAAWRLSASRQECTKRAAAQGHRGGGHAARARNPERSAELVGGGVAGPSGLSPERPRGGGSRESGRRHFPVTRPPPVLIAQPSRAQVPGKDSGPPGGVGRQLWERCLASALLYISKMGVVHFMHGTRLLEIP